MQVIKQRSWEELTKEEQTALRIEYGRDLGQLPPTYSLKAKILRFARWLAERNILYPLEV